MTLTKKVEAEIRGVYGAFWESYLRGDMKTMGSFLSDDFTLIGTSDGEVFNNKKSSMKYLKATIDQVAGILSKKNIEIKIAKVDDTVLVTEFFDAYVNTDSLPTFYGKFRATSVMKRVRGKWKIIHQHGSLPDSKAEVGETLATAIVKRENRELRDAVKRRTRELEQKNRDLEIETSLEKVRARAMSMQASAELADLIGTIYTELTRLDVTLDRCFIMLFDEPTGDATWWMASGETTSLKRGYHVPFHKHRPHLAYLKGWKNQESTWKYALKGDVKKKWDTLLFSKTELSQLPNGEIKNMKAGKLVYLSAAFNKYGGITTGTLEPLASTSFDLLARFSRVFEQTYVRFLDLQNAEAQARESQIQLALERLRARTMAMHHSSELSEAAILVFEQLSLLGVTLWGCGFNICHEENVERWMSLPNGKMLDPLIIPYASDKSEQEFFDIWKSGVEIHSRAYEGDELLQGFESLKLRPSTEIIHKRLQKIGIPLPNWMMHHIVPYKHGYLWIMVTKPFAETQIFVRFAKVFEQTYTRFLDLNKAEAQAREAQIEAALERVRSRTMAMHKSEDLLDVITVVSEQLQHVGIKFGTVSFGKNSASFDMEFWVAAPDLKQPIKMFAPYSNISIYNHLKEAYRERRGYFSDTFTAEETKIWNQHIIDHNPELFSEKSRGYLTSRPGMTRSTVLLKNVFLFLINYDFVTYSNEDIEIVIRFANVFEQTYTRFLDLEKAEGQAREAQVQLSLERVRARAMAMHHSEELSEVLSVLFEQFDALNISPVYTFLSLIDIEKNLITYRQTGKGGRKVLAEITFPLDAIGGWGEQEVLTRIKQGDFDLVHCRHFPVETFPEIWNVFGKIYDALPEGSKVHPEDFPNGLFTVQGFCKYGYIGYDHHRESTEEEKTIVKRFATEFGRLYQRFLDLKKAEAQAREAQVESVLEKIRSRSLAMHHSVEIKDVVAIMFEKMKELNVVIGTIAIQLFDENTMNCIFWAGNNLHNEPPRVKLPYYEKMLEEDGYMKDSWECKKKGEDLINKEYTFEQKTRFFDYVFASNDLATIREADRDVIRQAVINPSNPYIVCLINEKNSSVFADSWNGELYSEESIKVLIRAAKVFEQAYVRFLDLQKAEAQARESQIEAALERVRARTMAMHKSEELLDVIVVVSQQMSHLGYRFDVVSFARNTEMHDYRFWFCLEKAEKAHEIHVPYLNNPMFERIKGVMAQGAKFYADTLTVAENREWIEHMLAHDAWPDLTDEVKAFLLNRGYARSIVFMPQIMLILGNYFLKPYSDEQNNILQRFAAVFEQSYTRFLDLQKAEVHAKEAVCKASLDRVRAEIASMRTVEDLDRITPLIWRELNTIGIPFIRCGVFIMDEPNRVAHTFLSTPDGKAIAVFQLPFDVRGRLGRIVPHWQDKKTFLDYWDEVAMKEVADTLVAEGIFSSSQQYLDTLPKKGFHLHLLPFAQGMLYVGNFTQLRDEELTLLQSLADAFATAYARYDDFNKLEAAKQQVDRTLNDLKQAQQQLVQSEKMASLGELTAGIAHEIQNPLNFVNNFSEVSNELIDEMKTELQAGNLKDAAELAESIRQNLEKITHHGKRADGIVKGMLQHSRAGSGQKEPTDLNFLCDEYLRLAYHGYRAKDKSFNAKFEMNFDATLPKVNVVPQDMGRVILNLINNAFYAAIEKNKSATQGYVPTVWVSTRRLDDRIELRVCDNGPGISASIKEKIFQPFFTTKPTGQGTGLGLSLSYDIIKAHGGTLEVNSPPAGRAGEEGQGSEFVIQLPAQ